MTKEQFLSSIQEGKWFTVKGRHGEVYAVKMKEVQIAGRAVVYSLWLSYQDTEAMSFSEYVPTDWEWKDNAFVSYSSGVYHFGGSNVGQDDDIYDEETGELLEDKMKKIILAYAMKDFISEEELETVWSLLKEKKALTFDTLEYV